MGFGKQTGGRNLATTFAMLAGARYVHTHLLATLHPHRSARRRSVGKHALLLLALAAFGLLPNRAQASEARHGIAMHGEPALPEGFDRMPYANAAAPKGGRLVQGVLGTFDSLNPFVVRGIAPPSIRGYVVESLMTR